MKEETLSTISRAISDVGYWRWWITENDCCQIEFGGIQLLSNDTINENSKSAVMALQYSNNSFLIFYDNDEQKNWYIELQNDKIEPFSIDHDFFSFNNIENIDLIRNGYKNETIIKKIDSMENIKNILCFRAGNVAVIIGGNDYCFLDEEGKISEEKLLKRSKLWWIYWKDYYKKRNTKEAYEKDYVCDVTIPIKE
jgi:hypothetical protein